MIAKVDGVIECLYGTEACALVVGRKDGLVVLDTGWPTPRIALGPDEARALARELDEYAEQVDDARRWAAEAARRSGEKGE